MESDFVGKIEHPDVLTGQVPAWPECKSHRETLHRATDAGDDVYWCNRCGWNRLAGLRLGRPNGGWA